MERKEKYLYKELKAFDDMRVILQYMYLGNTITVINSIGIPLELSVTDGGLLCSKNMNFPDQERVLWTEHMDIETAMGIVEQLSEKPAVRKCNFSNAWEEIHAIVELNIAEASRCDGTPVISSCPKKPTEVQMEISDVINPV